MKHLQRDGEKGFREVAGEPVDEKKEPLRPWAVTPDGRVVYAPWKQQGFGLQGVFELAMGGMQSKVSLKAYDKQVSLNRRREFETNLALDAGRHPECVTNAVGAVTKGLLDYVAGNTEAAGKVIKTRCYGDTASGRLGTSNDASTLSDSSAWDIALKTLGGTDIPKIIGIQSSLANVLSRTLPLSKVQQVAYKDTAIKVAPKDGHLYQWFNDDAARGRQKKAGGAAATTAPGLMTGGEADNGGEQRKRGIDEWERVEDSAFIKGIDMRNLAFGAGRSGTTGELLKTYRTFGGSDTGEPFKQYLLAIVIYLVSGGHHSCHEIFSVANLLVGGGGPRGSNAYSSVAALVKGAYVPGRYVNHLPDSYLNTNHFETLKEKYYDIAMMGHLHGTFV